MRWQEASDPYHREPLLSVSGTIAVINGEVGKKYQTLF
jgi:hypothetical protein